MMIFVLILYLMLVVMLAPSTAPIFAPPYEANDEDAEAPLAPEASETGAEIVTESAEAPKVLGADEKAHMYQHARWARFADGADEVHQMRIAQRTISSWKDTGSVQKGTGDLPI